ncbi:MAG: hypothetical protein JWN18_264 [Parcubacteria group bacterium]|nr:hypothetical protein [Parcubacteria group bacterium]
MAQKNGEEMGIEKFQTRRRSEAVKNATDVDVQTENRTYDELKSRLETAFFETYPEPDMSVPEQKQLYNKLSALRKELAKSINQPAKTRSLENVKAQIDAFREELKPAQTVVNAQMTESVVPEASVTQPQEAKPFNPHSVASIQTVEEQQKNLEGRKHAAVLGIIPPVSINDLDIDITHARTPQYMTRPEMQKDMDAWAAGSIAPTQTEHSEFSAPEALTALFSGHVPAQVLEVYSKLKDQKKQESYLESLRKEIDEEKKASAVVQEWERQGPTELGNPWGRGGLKRGIFREQLLSLYPPNPDGTRDAKHISESDWRKYEDLAEEQQKNFASGDEGAEEATLEKIAQFLLEPKVPITDEAVLVPTAERVLNGSSHETISDKENGEMAQSEESNFQDIGKTVNIDSDSSSAHLSLELAKEFLKLGDRDTAEQYLQEVIAEGDDTEKAEALTLLGKAGHHESVETAPKVFHFRPGHEKNIPEDAVFSDGSPLNPEPRQIPSSESPKEQTQNEQPETPKEWKAKLRELISGAKDSTKEKVNWYKSSEEGLIRRSAELDLKAENIGGIEKWFRNVGENYNKKSFTTKLAMGAGLGLGAFAFSTIAPPVAAAFMLGLGYQRTAALSTMFLKFEKKAVDDKKTNAKEWSMLKAIGYTVAMGAAIQEALLLANQTETGQKVHEYIGEKAQVVGEKTQEWLKQYWPFKGGVKPEGTWAESTPGNPSNLSPQPQKHPEITSSGKLLNDTNISERIEGEIALPDDLEPIAATKGKGTEYMIKRMWKQLSEKHLDASSYYDAERAPDQQPDIYKLLTADEETIDKVVHKIAADPKHGFYHPGGTNARVDLDSVMSFDTHGEITLDGMMETPNDGPITPPYNHAANAENPAISDETSDDGFQRVSATDESFHIQEQLERDSIGEPRPINGGAPEGLQDADSIGTQDSTTSSAPESGTIENQPSLPQTKEFLSDSGLKIEPREGHVFVEKGSGVPVAYGEPFEARWNAANEYAKAHPGEEVSVEAERLVILEDGKAHSWVHAVKATKILGMTWVSSSVEAPPSSLEAPNLRDIDPKKFTKQLQ